MPTLLAITGLLRFSLLFREHIRRPSHRTVVNGYRRCRVINPEQISAAYGEHSSASVNLDHLDRLRISPGDLRPKELCCFAH
jgi:hypothetical protein